MHWDDMLVLESDDHDYIHIHGVEIGDLLQLFRNSFVSKYPDLTNLKPFERNNLKELKSYFEKLDV
jgi:L-ribulose-5-phosphate 3-epimerase UlaE